MNDTLRQLESLLREVAEHMASATRTDKIAAVSKLHRIAEIASTLAFTIEGPRR